MDGRHPESAGVSFKQTIERNVLDMVYLRKLNWIKDTFSKIHLFTVNVQDQSALPCACIRPTTTLLTMTGDIGATLAVGHRLRGTVGSYKMLEQFSKIRDVWKAM